MSQIRKAFVQHSRKSFLKIKWYIWKQSSIILFFDRLQIGLMINFLRINVESLIWKVFENVEFLEFVYFETTIYF